MLIESIDITVTHRCHSGSNEVDGVRVGCTLVIEKLLLLRHPLAVQGAHVDPHAGEYVNHD